MQILNDNKRITVKDLSKRTGISEVTLRTDLNIKDKEGLLTRTHGGAVLNNYSDSDTSFQVRINKNQIKKRKIAEKALDFIEEKQCILIDASSTALELALLSKKT